MYIKKLIEDTIMVIILLVVTLSCRKMIIDKNRNSEEVLNKIGSYSVNVVSNNETLYLVSDEYAKNKMEYDNIQINNNSNTASDYKLYLRLDDNSTLDINSLKVSVNDEEYILNDLYEYEIDGYKYYNIHDSLIDKVDNVSFKVWISNSLVDNISGESLIYSFVVV